VDIEEAGQDELAGRVHHLGTVAEQALADGGNPLAADANIDFLQPVGTHHGAVGDDCVELHGRRLSLGLPHSK
jgi:hypothetical protein